jgi:hypothetical protein
VISCQIKFMPFFHAASLYSVPAHYADKAEFRQRSAHRAADGTIPAAFKVSTRAAQGWATLGGNGARKNH